MSLSASLAQADRQKQRSVMRRISIQALLLFTRTLLPVLGLRLNPDHFGFFLCSLLLCTMCKHHRNGLPARLRRRSRGLLIVAPSSVSAKGLWCGKFADYCRISWNKLHSRAHFSGLPTRRLRSAWHLHELAHVLLFFDKIRSRVGRTERTRCRAASAPSRDCTYSQDTSGRDMRRKTNLLTYHRQDYDTGWLGGVQNSNANAKGTPKIMAYQS